MRGVGELVRNR